MTAPPILLSRGAIRERSTFTLSARQQKIFGVFLLFHGLAHAGIGLWAGETGRWWLPISLWELSMVGFLAAGFGAMGVSGLKEFWRPLSIISAVSSLVLLILTPGVVLVLGLTVDFVALSLVAYSRDAATEKNPALRRHHALRVTGAILSWALLVYVAVVLALRPWNVQWVLVAKSATLRGAAAARSPSISDSEGEQSGRCSGNLAQKTSGLTTDLVLRKRQLTHHGILRGLPTST
jgi:hypothetical protein